MKKKIIMRGLFGLPTGIAIGFVITLIISICSHFADRSVCHYGRWFCSGIDYLGT